MSAALQAVNAIANSNNLRIDVTAPAGRVIVDNQFNGGILRADDTNGVRC
jgi:hypothetical protein